MSDSPLPRADDPVPPGMVTESFWQRSATQGAIIVTVAFALTCLRAALVGDTLTRDALYMGIEGAVWAWLGAFGLHRLGPSGLRWR